jgi:membrane fusion protein (multidrug efflux system)
MLNKTETRSEERREPFVRTRQEQRPPEPPSLSENKTTWRSVFVRRPAIAFSILLVLIAIVAGGVTWWLNARHYESTDDAFIDARTVSISSQINGAIVDVPVTDNQLVDAGAVLLRIDDRDYRAALDQAKAQIDQAQGSIANIDAQIGAQQAIINQAQNQVAGAEAALTFSRQESERAQTLFSRGAGTQQQAQQTSSDLRQKQAAYDAAEASLAAAQKQLPVLQTQRQVAQGQLEQSHAARELAQANLARTVVTAPAAGRVTKLTAAKGDYAQAGQSVMMFVPLNLWVTANFKETQLADMQPGQPVQIWIDAYPGRPFDGRVDSIQAGSGAVFSLLPPENATGNYVKVVQRVPVKIVFDRAPDVYIGPGMSVVPYVKVR